MAKVTNITNALFFWAMLPETRKLALEDMNRLFSEAPLFVGNRDLSQYYASGVSELAHDIDEKQQSAPMVHSESIQSA